MTPKPRPVALATQQQALSRYLESLLAEVPEYRPEAPVSDPAPTPAEVKAPVQVKTPPAPVVEAPAPAEAPAPMAPAPAERRPRWAAEPFPCLLFRVDGLSLAVPLVHLSGVLPWPEQITPMPGHQPFFLGLHPHQGRNIKVVDTARVVMPPERLRGGEASGYGNIVVIDDGRWGLACASVDEMVTIDPERVKWRSAGGKRPWLAGTVIDQMCALLDVAAFARMLESGDRGT